VEENDERKKNDGENRNGKEFEVENEVETERRMMLGVM